MASILLLDDDSYFRKLAGPALQARGHQVTEASKCRDADALVAGRKFDAIIVDGLLPDLDGLSWIHRFRARDAETPILFISAFWRGDQKVRELPVSVTLKKPIAPGLLVAKVESCLPMAMAAGGPTAESSATASSELLQLAKTFECDLPKLLRGIRDAVEQLRRAPGSGPIRGVAQRRAHQVAGTAGSFGFPALGDACAKIEDALVSMLHSPATEVTWRVIDAALQALNTGVPAPIALSA